jgi:uncharacterized repeat protein (TIGR03803 family)
MTTAERAHKLPAYRVLYSFRGGTDGSGPGSLLNVNGTLYGTTGGGGMYGYGTVFAITSSGRETVLYSFGKGTDGIFPGGGLVDVNGTLYGTTGYGGTYSYGTVFAVTTSGRETVLYSFKGGTDGWAPTSRLLDVNGDLYGTTKLGGAYCSGAGCGTVFSVTTSGKETVLYRFKGGTADGQNPYAGLIDVKGELYGTTSGGGAHCAGGYRDCGTVFSIMPSGKETVRYSFKGGTTDDGQSPQAALIDVRDTLYGTTTGGGSYGNGTVFAVTTSGMETVLHSFSTGHDGAIPEAPLLDMNGMLYGTTSGGATNYYGNYGGTVFEISTSGKERVLHNFGSAVNDGLDPSASLTNVKGTLYGATPVGGTGSCSRGSGSYGCGTVFALKP